MKNFYYLYIIRFGDGRYYIGSRGCDCRPEDDMEYTGSPITFKHLWTDPNLTKKKYIIKEFSSYDVVRRLETVLIEAAWKRDGKDICVNRNSAPRFHPEICRLNAEKKAKEFVLVSPTGEVIRAKNMHNFGRVYDLDWRHIQKVLKGQRKHHKGWTKYVEN
jgi:hypothetical protein